MRFSHLFHERKYARKLIYSERGKNDVSDFTRRIENGFPDTSRTLPGPSKTQPGTQPFLDPSRTLPPHFLYPSQNLPKPSQDPSRTLLGPFQDPPGPFQVPPRPYWTLPDTSNTRLVFLKIVFILQRWPVGWLAGRLDK